MKLKIANAPVSWGVDYAEDAKNPAWREVLDQIRDAGYRYTEVGPYGYYPTDVDVLRAQFASRGLIPVGGFVFQFLHVPEKSAEVLAVAERTIKLLAGLGARHLVTIDHISEERMATAGMVRHRTRLDPVRQAHLLSQIDRIADLALAAGVMPVIHQHAGCYIEYEDEFEALLAKLEPSRVGICIDTGHMSYAGIDPVAFYKRHAQRVQYFHFKDINPEVHARVVETRVPFLAAVTQGVFCPLGKGMVDWRGLAAALEDNGYDGVATVEQDIDPTISSRPLDDARSSLAFLRSLGF